MLTSSNLVDQSPISLLLTKLYLPHLRHNLVLRPRLIDRLNQGLTHPLCLITAPAGFGKTTLVSDWLQQVSWPTAWLSLDEDDNDLTRFLDYVTAALQNIDSTIGQKSQPEPQTTTAAASTESRLTALVNDLAAIPTDFVLVLDDYHLIQAGPVHQALTFLLDHPPAGLHLVIISRTEPPLPLARLRAHHDLTELQATELRFTSVEAATFLNQVMGLSLSAPEVAALEARTEGWITGLQLAALSMQDCADIAAFIAAFSGSHRYIFDYLAAEVLQQQPDFIQRFLLQTSILNRLTASLCNAVTGQAGSQARLAQLEQANLFLIPLDDERRWYRYHHLFADFLRERLQHELGGPGVAALHRRAAAWYEQNGLIAEAMGHALAVADVARAARLVEQSGRSLLRRSELSMVQSWLRELPEELVRARPRLSLFQAWAMVFTGQLDKLEAQLHMTKSVAGQPADQLLDPVGQDRQPAIPGELTAIEGTVAYFRRDYARAIELYQQALAQLPEENLFLRSAIAFSLATACNISGNLSGAMAAFDQGRLLSQAGGNIDLALIASSNLAQLHLEQGQLRQAADLYRQALQLNAQHDPSYVSGRLQVGLGEVLYQWHDLPAASEAIDQGLKIGQQYQEPISLIYGDLTQAQVRYAQGQPEAAFELLDRAEQQVHTNNLPSWTPRLVACRIRLRLRQGELATAVREFQQTPFSSSQLAFDDTAGYPADLRRLVRLSQARLQLAQAMLQKSASAGQIKPVLDLLTEIRQELENAAHFGQLLEVRNLQALAYQAQNEPELAIASLQQALDLAEPAGYVRLFLDEGQPMLALLGQAASASPSPYVSQLLAAFETEPTAVQPSALSLAPLVEPLSQRELEILQHIAAGLSNRQIADTLSLTVGTVKWHLNNIYGKLGVRSRTQAVAQARSRRLLA